MRASPPRAYNAQCRIYLRTAREYAQKCSARLTQKLKQLTDEPREERPQRNVAEEQQSHGGPLVEHRMRPLHVANELRPKVQSHRPVPTRTRCKELQRVACRRVVPRVRAPCEHRDASERARCSACRRHGARPASRHPLQQKAADVPPRLRGELSPRVIEAKRDGAETKERRENRVG